MYGYHWFKDEQLTKNEMNDILKKVKGKHFDITIHHFIGDVNFIYCKPLVFSY